MAIKKLYRYFSSPLLAIAIVFFILGGMSFATTKPLEKVQPQEIKISSVVPTKVQNSTVIEVVKQTAPKQAILSMPSPSSVPQRNVQGTTIPVSQPVQSANQSPTSVPVDTISVQISEPDGDTSFSLSFHENSNPCSVLNDAKNEGKIRSVTVTHYGPPLNSDYVKEMNGYQDNWTFVINGEGRPLGCSNYILGKGNTVTWKYK